MTTYLVVHTPKPDAESAAPSPPTRLVDLAREHGRPGARPRWLRAWSPDLHDDRIFSLWEAANADEIRRAIERFGFLDTMEAQPVNVREWGPDDVLAAEAAAPT